MLDGRKADHSSTVKDKAGLTHQRVTRERVGLNAVDSCHNDDSAINLDEDGLVTVVLEKSYQELIILYLESQIQ